MISERAIVTRRFMPPDSGSILLFGPVGELHELEQLRGAAPALGARQVEVAAVEHEVVEHGELLVELVLLGHDADPGPDLLAVAGRVHARRSAARRR